MPRWGEDPKTQNSRAQPGLDPEVREGSMDSNVKELRFARGGGDMRATSTIEPDRVLTCGRVVSWGGARAKHREKRGAC